MSFIIQKPSNFFCYINGRKVFVEGFIYRYNITLADKEKSEICEKLNIADDNDQAFSRVRFESVLILTVNDDQNIRASKIVVESCQLVGNAEGIERERRRVRQNLEKAIEITFEQLSKFGAWGVEVGMLLQSGLKETLKTESAQPVGWFKFTDDKLLQAVSEDSKMNGSILTEILDLMELAEA